MRELKKIGFFAVDSGFYILHLDNLFNFALDTRNTKWIHSRCVWNTLVDFHGSRWFQWIQAKSPNPENAASKTQQMQRKSSGVRGMGGLWNSIQYVHQLW